MRRAAPRERPLRAPAARRRRAELETAGRARRRRVRRRRARGRGLPARARRKGDVIDGLDAAGALDGVTVFHAGTDVDDRRPGRDQRRARAHRDRDRRRPRRRRATAPTRPRPASRGPASTTVATSQPRRSRDPPLLAPRDRRAVHRRGALRRVARGRGARGRGVGRARRGPAGRRARRSASAPRFDVAAIHEREKVTDHDVAAFVDVVQETRRPARRRVGALRAHVERRRRHRARAADDACASTCILGAAAELESAIAARAREFRDTPMVGRTHGIHAEPTTFGVKLALWAMQVRRDRERLAAGPRHRSRSASCRARSARTRTSIPRSSGTCASTSG